MSDDGYYWKRPAPLISLHVMRVGTIVMDLAAARDEAALTLALRIYWEALGTPRGAVELDKQVKRVEKDVREFREQALAPVRARYLRASQRQADAEYTARSAERQRGLLLREMYTNGTPMNVLAVLSSQAGYPITEEEVGRLIAQADEPVTTPDEDGPTVEQLFAEIPTSDS